MRPPKRELLVVGSVRLDRGVFYLSECQIFPQCVYDTTWLAPNVAVVSSVDSREFPQGV